MCLASERGGNKRHTVLYVSTNNMKRTSTRERTGVTIDIAVLTEAVCLQVGYAVPFPGYTLRRRHDSTTTAMKYYSIIRALFTGSIVFGAKYRKIANLLLFL